MAGLDRLPPTLPAVNVAAYQELNRVAANINQFAKAANAGRSVDVVEIRQTIDELRLLLLGIRGSLDGGEPS